MPAIAPVWEADAATGSATSATFTATGSVAAGGSVVLVVENAAAGAVVDSITAANGDAFTLDASQHMPGSNITFESWRCPATAGGANVLYTINFHGATALNPRYWAQGFNQPLAFVLDAAADGAANLVLAVSAGEVGILVARTPTSWPPAGYTIVGTAGSAHCAQQVYAASGTETITVNNGGAFGAVYGSTSAAVSGAGGVVGTFAAGNPSAPIVKAPGAGSLAGSFGAAAGGTAAQVTGGAVQAAFTASAATPVTVIPRSGNVAGAFLAGNPITPAIDGGAPLPGWPTIAEVKAFLRIASDDDDDVMQMSLDAAIDYGQRRTDHVYDDGAVAVPGTVHHACLLHASRLYRRRDSTDGTIGFGDAGVVRIGRTDPDIEALYGAVGPMVFG